MMKGKIAAIIIATSTTTGCTMTLDQVLNPPVSAYCSASELTRKMLIREQLNNAIKESGATIEVNCPNDVFNTSQ